MKKSLKRYLILALVVMAMVATTIFVSAADVSRLECPEHGLVAPVLGQVIEPQCETEGYTELVCPKCGVYLNATTNSVAALGHNLIEHYELAESGTNYERIMRCDAVGCNYSEIDTEVLNGAETPVKYYKVNFINSFVTDTYEQDIKYANLAATYKEEVLATKYIREGQSAAYQGTCYRMADKTFGGYTLLGWASADKIAEAASSLAMTFSMDIIDAQIANAREYVDGVLVYKNQDQHDIIFGNADGTIEPIYVENGFAVPVDNVVKAEYDMYAIFDTKSVNHSVKFYNDKGALISTQTVNHSEKVDAPEAPAKADNVEYKYEFAGYWTLFDDANKVDLNHIYGDVQVKAAYEEELKRYLLKYFDKDGVTPITIGGEEVTDFVNIAGFSGDRDEPEKGREIRLDNYFDAAYDYNFTGEWQILGRNNTVVNLYNVTLPTDVLDFDQTGGYIALVPRYAKILREYTLVIHVTYPDDGDYHPDKISLQVTNAEGKAIGVYTLTEADIVSGKGTDTPVYKKTFKVNYSSAYRVTASATNYTGVGTSRFYIADPAKRDSYAPGGVTMNMERIKGDPCSCICHTILKPVWVGILNLLNTLFKAEYVCCDDMFANIGADLNYGPGK